MNELKITQYKADALANKSKKASEIKIGDKLYLTTRYGKEDSLFDFCEIDEGGNDSWYRSATLCSVVDIVDVPEDYNITANWLSNETPANRGGSRSDDVADDVEPWDIPRELSDTFYNLVTVFRKPSGKFIAVDCQCYNYWRYVYLPMNYTEIFKDECTYVGAYLFHEYVIKKEEHEKELTDHARALRERMDELRAMFPMLQENPTTTRAIATNVRKFLQVHFPQIKFKVSARKPYYASGGVDVVVSVPTFTPKETEHEIMNVCKLWFEHMPDGVMYEDYTTYGEKITREGAKYTMQSLFGKIKYNGISLRWHA